MNFDLDGFLSPDIADWIEDNRRAHASWFALIYGVNRIAQSRLLSLKVDGGDLQGIFAAALYGRGLTNLQGAIVLVERGIQPGARTLLRNCFEDIFYLGAVQSAEDYYEKFAQADRIERTRIARAVLGISEGLASLDPAQREELREFIASTPADLPRTTPVTVAQAARDAGLSEVYDIYYRGLSNDAAHPSVVALGRHISEEKNEFLWGPEPKQMVDTLMAAGAAAFYLAHGVDNYIGDDHQKAELGKCWAEYKELLHEIEEDGN